MGGQRYPWIEISEERPKRRTHRIGLMSRNWEDMQIIAEFLISSVEQTLQRESAHTCALDSPADRQRLRTHHKNTIVVRGMGVHRNSFAVSKFTNFLLCFTLVPR